MEYLENLARCQKWHTKCQLKHWDSEHKKIETTIKKYSKKWEEEKTLWWKCEKSLNIEDLNGEQNNAAMLRGKSCQKALKWLGILYSYQL